MKLKFKSCVGGALFLSLALGAAPSLAQAQTDDPDMKAVATESEDAFTKRFNELYEANNWREMQRVGVARRLGHPTESRAWYAEVLGAYMNGDVDAAIEASQRNLALGASADTEQALATLRAVRANFPNAQFKPLEFVGSDTEKTQQPYRDKVNALFKAKDYGGIETLAAELQKSNAGDLLSHPFLQTLFDVISDPTDNPKARLDALEDWQKSKPQSALPRLAIINYWVSMAYRERGGGSASTISPEMSAKIDSTLENATQGIADLPASAHDSPILYVVLQNWVKLSGAGRPFLDAVFAEGSAQFPNYLPIYLERTTNLLPRWFGQPGEWEAMAKKRADQIGGTAGDVFYALIFIDAYSYVNTMKDEPVPDKPINMARFWRGLATLRAKYPDSATLRTAQLYISDDQASLPDSEDDLARAQSALTEPNGNVIDESAFLFRSESFRQNFGSHRMKILAAPRAR